MFIQKMAIVLLGVVILLPIRGDLRRRAWFKITTATFVEILIVTCIRFYRIDPEDRFALWLAAYPLVYASVGAMELLTGKPFLKLADQWNGLASTQREQISFFAISFTLALFAIACVLYIKISIAPRRN